MGCVTFLLHNNNWHKLESHLGQRGVDWSQAVGIKTKRNKHKTEMWGEQEIKCVGEWDWVREETGETSHHIKSPSHSRALRFGLWIMDSSVLNMDESLPTIQPWSEWGASVWSVCLYTFAHIHTHTHTHTHNKTRLKHSNGHSCDCTWEQVHNEIPAKDQPSSVYSWTSRESQN